MGADNRNAITVTRMEGDKYEIKTFRKIRKLNRTDKHEYQGWLGGVVHKGPYFFASKDGTLIGAYKTFDEAMKALTLGEMLGGGQ